MKRIYKVYNKKGFTLVEVMLAVAILSMASLMIMRGFLATMNMANNSSIFSRLGSTNYSTAIKRMSTLSGQGDSDPVVRNTSVTGNLGVDLAPESVTITVTGSSLPVSTLRVGVLRVNSNPAASFPNYNCAGMYDDNTALSTSRTSFFYYLNSSAACPKCGRRDMVRPVMLGSEFIDGQPHNATAWACTNTSHTSHGGATIYFAR